MFPFKFSGITYGACADYYGQLVCATELDNNGNAVNYGVCGPHCPMEGNNKWNVLLNTFFFLDLRGCLDLEASVASEATCFFPISPINAIITTTISRMFYNYCILLYPSSLCFRWPSIDSAFLSYAPSDSCPHTGCLTVSDTTLIAYNSVIC